MTRGKLQTRLGGTERTARPYPERVLCSWGNDQIEVVTNYGALGGVYDCGAAQLVDYGGAWNLVAGAEGCAVVHRGCRYA